MEEETVEEMFEQWFSTFEPSKYDYGRVAGEMREVMLLAYQAGFEKASEFDWE